MDYADKITAVSILLLLSSAALLILHTRSWRKSRRLSLETPELEFRRRQYRRRMQSSAMLGILAIAFSLAPYIKGPPWLILAYLIAVVVVTLWMGALAVTDALASRAHFNRLQESDMNEQLKLKQQIRRTESDRGNGRKKE
jgi:hypothetical protein